MIQATGLQGDQNVTALQAATILEGMAAHMQAAFTEQRGAIVVVNDETLRAEADQAHLFATKTFPTRPRRIPMRLLRHYAALRVPP